MIVTFAITYECSKGCRYCFQGSERAFRLPHMRLKDFTRALQWLRRTGQHEIKITGGEPTEHPQFAGFWETAQEHGFRVVLMTNGSFDFGLLPDIGALAGAFVHMRPPPHEDRALASVHLLQDAGVPVVLSYTITGPGTLADMVKLAASLRKAALRIDLARWDLVRSNDYVPFDDYQFYRDEILDGIALADALGVSVNLDCPLPLCLFKEHERDVLRAHGLRGVCSPFPLVNPDLSVGCCPYPGLLQTSLLDLRPDSLHNRLHNHPALAQLRWTQPMHENCASCRFWLEKQCQGGCIRGKSVLPMDARHALPFITAPGGK